MLTKAIIKIKHYFWNPNGLLKESALLDVLFVNLMQ